MDKPLAFSIGHSNKTLLVFLEKLKEYRIAILVDVRTYPSSRFSPHFNAMPLGRALVAENIQYLIRGRNLGGRGVNNNFEGAIRELVRMTRNGVRVCVMCAEADPRRCHRYTVLEPALWEHGVSICHIAYD
ncbi:DUF488 domain-containing protein [Candidatus Parcubacteria bacterium]|nr:MAG: DUF488 domain-containing protein [Candidatus Parcubacteria bacterium]